MPFRKFLMVLFIFFFMGTVSNPTMKNRTPFRPKPMMIIKKGVMLASYYGAKFHGRKTANGETFNQHSLTAAHRKFRFGTLLRLTNKLNGKSVVVRINDRGPFIPGRQLDISHRAAKVLDIVKRGIAKLHVEEISYK